MTTETRWHHHWYIEVHKEGRIYRFLRKPRLRTCDKARAEKSRWVWGVKVNAHGTVYTLTILGVLHTLTGLTLIWEPDDKDDGDD